MKNLNFKERVDLDIKEIEKTKERFKLFINRHHKNLEKISPNLISKLCLTFGLEWDKAKDKLEKFKESHKNCGECE